MQCIKTSTYFHNYSIKNVKVTNMTSQTLNTPVQQMKEKSLLQVQKLFPNTNTLLGIQQYYCLIQWYVSCIYSTIFIFDIKPMYISVV